MIKPSSQRAEEYIKAGIVATSALDMARSFLAILGEERKILETDVWSARNSAEGYFDIRSRHKRLCETIDIVERIICHMEGGTPPARRLPHLRRPESAYGER